jgi:hypothetical protein
MCWYCEPCLMIMAASAELNQEDVPEVIEARKPRVEEMARRFENGLPLFP